MVATLLSLNDAVSLCLPSQCTSVVFWNMSHFHTIYLAYVFSAKATNGTTIANAHHTKPKDLTRISLSTQSSSLGLSYRLSFQPPSLATHSIPRKHRKLKRFKCLARRQDPESISQPTKKTTTAPEKQAWRAGGLDRRRGLGLGARTSHMHASSGLLEACPLGTEASKPLVAALLPFLPHHALVIRNPKVAMPCASPRPLPHPAAHRRDTADRVPVTQPRGARTLPAARVALARIVVGVAWSLHGGASAQACGKARRDIQARQAALTPRRLGVRGSSLALIPALRVVLMSCLRLHRWLLLMASGDYYCCCCPADVSVSCDCDLHSATDGICHPRLGLRERESVG